MRQWIGAMVLSATVLSSAALAGGTFTLDGKNTKIGFTGTKPGGKHVGGFEKVTGTASASGDATTLKLEVEIDTTSIFSDTEKLTQHLKSPDFFAVKSNPKAKFASTKVEKSGTGYTVTGDLTLLGKTKSISFPASIKVAADGLSLTSEFEINKGDFGMTYGAGKIDEQVKLKVSVNATK